MEKPSSAKLTLLLNSHQRLCSGSPFRIRVRNRLIVLRTRDNSACLNNSFLLQRWDRLFGRRIAHDSLDLNNLYKIIQYFHI